MYKGQLSGFPVEIVDKMLEYQVKQGNPKDVTVFENEITSADEVGGFWWEKTPEGKEFWRDIILNKNFDLFFEKYPYIIPLEVQTFIDFMTTNKINMLVWEWSECPLEEKWSLGHGRDEDYVVLWKTNDWMVENAVDRLTVCDRNDKEYNEYTLTVTAHS